ncbi:MAG: hypothetical protein V3V92_06515 [Candidatus Hydrothermarchaeales archaeon]
MKMSSKEVKISFVSLWKGRRGQVSIELVTLAGIMVIMGIMVFPFITNEITLNKAHAAARDGATGLVGLFNMGYKFTISPTMIIEGPQKSMRLKQVNLDYLYTVNGTREYEINLVVDFPDDETSVNKTSLGNAIVFQAMSSINYAFTSNWLPVDPDANDTVVTDTITFYPGNVTWE